MDSLLSPALHAPYQCLSDMEWPFSLWVCILGLHIKKISSLCKVFLYLKNSHRI